MRFRITVCLTGVALLAGCKAIDGTYYPGCVAFEGDKVVLRDGSVEWDRFTDQVIVDVDGNVMDPFPEYPKMGSYAVDGDLLHLTIQGEDAVNTLHIHTQGERIMLLNDADLATWESTGRYGDCVLTLAPEDGA